MYGVNGMFKYIMRNILMIIPTVLGVVFIVFTINQFTPGDPVILMLGADYTQEQYDETAAELGVDQPFFTQFFNYLKNIITKFDFGTSYSSKRPVMDEIAGRFSVSLKLGLLSCLVSVMIGVPLGIVSATKQYSVLDYSLTLSALFFSAVPNFWLSMMLILLFSLNLGWLPASGLMNWKAYIIPVIASSAGAMAAITRQTRSSMLEVIRQDYIRTARSKGLSEGQVIRKHALKNALIPVVTLVGMQLGMIMGGSAVIEAIHNIPGMGTLLLNAINKKDYPTIQTIVLILSVVVCGMNVLVDIIYALIDPRIKAQYQKKTVKKRA